MHRPRRNVIRDDVDEAADGVRAVQQRGRTAHHFDALGGGGIHADAMVARLARQIACPLAVLQNLHAIAVKPADDRTRRSGAEAARREAGLVLERRAERAFELLGQLLARQHRRRLERIELAARLGADRRDFLKVQIEVDAELDRGAAAQARRLPCAARSSPAREPRRDTCRARGCRSGTCRPVRTRPRASARRSTTVAPASGSPLSEFTSRPSSVADSCANAGAADARISIRETRTFMRSPSPNVRTCPPSGGP